VTLEPIPEDGIAIAEGSQAGVLYINLEGVGIVRYDLATHTYAATGVQSNATAFAYGGDGFWYVNGGAAAPNQLYRIKPEDPLFTPELVGTGARPITDIATAPNGTMYGIGEGHLFLLNKTDGTQTDLMALGFAADGLAFTASGDLLTADGVHLMEVDPPTASTTFLQDLPWPVRDLAGDPGGVAPSQMVTAASRWAVVLLCLGLVMVAVIQVRQRRTSVRLVG
jgi:hypothetical protein